MTRRQRIADAHQLARLIPTASPALRRALIRSVLLGLRVALR
jgi:hypothetical protein